MNIYDDVSLYGSAKCCVGVCVCGMGGEGRRGEGRGGKGYNKIIWFYH